MAGDQLTVVENEARAREVAQYRQEKATEKRTALAPTNFDTMFSNLKSDVVEYPVVVKADVQGSAEAIVNALVAAEGVRPRVVLRSADEERCAAAVLVGVDTEADDQWSAAGRQAPSHDSRKR